MIPRKSVNDKHQENGTPTGPLIFTLPATSFVIILNFDWFEGTKLGLLPQKMPERPEVRTEILKSESRSPRTP
jgi:hypothetical protein